MRRFYAPDISGSTIVLDQEQSRHLRNVLRMSEGDEAQVFDGRGNEFLCRIERIENRSAVLEIIEQAVPKATESHLEMILAAALLKGEKFELVIQKAVELGVNAVQPILTKRCETRSKDHSRKLDRWKKIIIESSKQAGRAKLMEIAAPTDFQSFVKNIGRGFASGGRLLFAESGGGSFAGIEPVTKMIAVIGPEGGWEDSEIDFARENDFRIITLGSRVLRAETAAIVVAGILQHRFGDLN